MKIMNVGLSTLHDIGFNYTVKLNEEELLVYEKEELSEPEASLSKKIEENEEKKSQKKSENSSPQELTEAEERMVKDLQSRDTEVRAHEAAHQAAGGGLTGPATFTYQQGPDGKMYAIGGEVSITTPASSSPEEAIANARQVITAAMAVSDPSPQDYAVAASARVMEIKAQQQLAKEQQEEMLGKEVYGLQNNLQDKQDQEKDDISIDSFDISA